MTTAPKNRAGADGQPAVGITDHGNMYGVLEALVERPSALLGVSLLEALVDEAESNTMYGEAVP
jgi:DNA polymerase III alpha subunit